ncbi:precorrin-6A/cobalt-precorrin-6A reductase [Leucothrix arctica]|uniref:Cobalt-precorrin-6A reductase n=1 Tax=Leucothrix arctica TaxID=1481894 RepID=A0A317CGV4_9GAMM|nr:precorrin-6A/cobalt-precorrin-6A reductase [Leucothrix arctica]PWQ95530.1 cobalt-precorrin-6A reductase [Leucothrix arctica]
MKLQILGGTGDAKQLAITLHNSGIEVIYSIAGIVRQPDLPCEVLSGGFSKRGGLTHYIRENKITALVNATHPFAQKMSLAAQRSAEQTGIMFWRYQRPDWQATEEDSWSFYEDWGQLLRQLNTFHSVFLSQGQLTESMLAALLMHRKTPQHFLHRTAVIPSHATPDWMSWEHGIGPFNLDRELALLQHYKIDAIVSKHSGGALPSKILAARALKLPVFLLERPSLLASKNEICDLAKLTNAIITHAKSV